LERGCVAVRCAPRGQAAQHRSFDVEPPQRARVPGECLAHGSEEAWARLLDGVRFAERAGNLVLGAEAVLGPPSSRKVERHRGNAGQLPLIVVHRGIDHEGGDDRTVLPPDRELALPRAPGLERFVDLAGELRWNGLGGEVGGVAPYQLGGGTTEEDLRVRVARPDRAGEVGDDDGRLHLAKQWRVEACPPGNLRPWAGHRAAHLPAPRQGADLDCTSARSRPRRASLLPACGVRLVLVSLRAPGRYSRGVASVGSVLRARATAGCDSPTGSDARPRPSGRRPSCRGWYEDRARRRARRGDRA